MPNGGGRGGGGGLLEGSLEISENLKWMKYCLCGYHDNWAMYKYFNSFSSKNSQLFKNSQKLQV